MSSLFETAYNPDVLSCLANLSNDEVFTPPEVANQMLDLLPEELWHDSNAKFLDPACKSGVFLREIAKRLIDGLEDEYPDLNERLEHIFKEQLYGIAITELTSLLSRRSLYCSKYPSSKYSVVQFDNSDGNVRYHRCEHTWYAGRCKYCGATQKEYERDESLEQYAYEFIHFENPEKAFEMKFDVIIGNPPYQLSDGGAQASAIPIYHKFIQQAKKLNPRYLTMIVPSRWFAGGRGLDQFRDEMLNDSRIRTLFDYFDSAECFPGVDISGGICYFLWDRDNPGHCSITSSINGNTSTMIRPLLEPSSTEFIRFNQAISIYRKVKEKKSRSFDELVSSQKPFGLRTYVIGKEKENCTDPVLLYSNKNVQKKPGYIGRSEIPSNLELVKSWKIFISRAYGERGSFPYLVIGKPFIGAPETACTETYLAIGPFQNEKQATNAISYMKTRFFRFLVLLQKNTQDAPKRVYKYVPLVDFNKKWTDDELYMEFGITKEEIAFIESMIRPMDLGDNNDE